MGTAGVTAAVILAGGEGRRMGGNKPLHPHEGGTLIGHVIARLRPQTEALYINAHPDLTDLEQFGLPLIFDAPEFAGLGPLSGVLSALRLAQARGEDTIVTLPCDMPDLPGDLVAQLSAAPATDVVHFTGRRDYPLCALWRITVLQHLETALRGAQGGLAVWRFLETLQVCKLVTTDDAAFININCSNSII
jgi:molybdenum cofactor guanylyltransferase